MSARDVSGNAWEWFGNAGHFIASSDCRFHLCTLIGEYLVSTVGEYLPDSEVREIMASSRGITLTGRGDARRANWMQKIGYETIGLDRKYETMVFRVSGKRCEVPDCGCGLPVVEEWGELDMNGYNDAGSATRGHYEMCRRWEQKQDGATP